jgi:hypothetical protein
VEGSLFAVFRGRRAIGRAGAIASAAVRQVSGVLFAANAIPPDAYVRMGVQVAKS